MLSAATASSLRGLTRRGRAVFALLAIATLVVLCRTAFLPRLAFAQQSAADRARIVRDLGTLSFDKIKNTKTHFASGKRHLAVAPLDVDDDGDDDGDDDCLGVDSNLDAILPQLPRIQAAVVVGVVRSDLRGQHGFFSVDRGVASARGPPRVSIDSKSRSELPAR